VKIENLPRIGQPVVDENLQPVGRVFDIMGPVSSPYAAVKPGIPEPQKLVRKMLYCSSQREERRR
jgi:rRNA processing protein Gar1